MTEEEKIFAGKMFDPRSEELRQIKHKAHEACRRYNTLDEYDPERQQLIRSFIGGIGKTFYFQGPIQINYGSHTFIGENFFANFGLTIMDDARVSSIPEITANHALAQIVHEAAIGRINNEQLLKLQTFGLTEQEAETVIVNAFLD